jgi:hypothetical protein
MVSFVPVADAGLRAGTESAFERAFGARWIADLVLFAAFVSLVKIFNANFLASTRLLFALGRRGLVHPALAAVHERHGTPHVAVALMAALTIVAALLGDALLIPITEVGSLASGAGWLSACAAFLLRSPAGAAGRRTAWAGALVLAIVCMKVVPGIPGASPGRMAGGALPLGWMSSARRSGSPPGLRPAGEPQPPPSRAGAPRRRRAARSPRARTSCPGWPPPDAPAPASRPGGGATARRGSGA